MCKTPSSKYCLAKANLTLAQDNLQAFRDIVRVNERRVKSGDLAEVELLRVQLAELQFENAVRQAELRVSTSKARLQLLVGRNRPNFDVTGQAAVATTTHSR